MHSFFPFCHLNMAGFLTEMSPCNMGDLYSGYPVPGLRILSSPLEGIREEHKKGCKRMGRLHQFDFPEYPHSLNKS